MHIPPQDKTRCDACRAPVVRCETAAKSGGHPVVVAVDVQPDVPGANPRKRYSPRTSETVVETRPVSTIVAVTVAPGNDALVPSTTVPASEASCAEAVPIDKARTETATSTRTRARIAHSLSAAGGRCEFQVDRG
jgi:hypothetical protein